MNGNKKDQGDVVALWWPCFKPLLEHRLSRLGRSHAHNLGVRTRHYIPRLFFRRPSSIFLLPSFSSCSSSWSSYFTKAKESLTHSQIFPPRLAWIIDVRLFIRTPVLSFVLESPPCPRPSVRSRWLAIQPIKVKVTAHPSLYPSLSYPSIHPSNQPSIYPSIHTGRVCDKSRPETTWLAHQDSCTTSSLVPTRNRARERI